jgi:hypothetical protein
MYITSYSTSILMQDEIYVHNFHGTVIYISLLNYLLHGAEPFLRN